jgi:hypothetical protein
MSFERLELACRCFVLERKRARAGDSLRGIGGDVGRSVFYAITLPPRMVADEDKVSIDTVPSLSSTQGAQRVAAVFDRFRGIPLPQGTARCGICHRALSTFRHRALPALHRALEDHPRSPKRPSNRLAIATAYRMAALCQRHPTRSAAQIQQRYGPEAPCPRTMQRLGQRLSLPRVSKRAAPWTQAKRLSAATLQQLRHVINTTPALGAQRLAWDLQNAHQLQISPSTASHPSFPQCEHPLTVCAYRIFPDDNSIGMEHYEV